MNYCEFIQTITDEVQTRAGEDARILVSPVRKANLPDLDGLTILHPGENAAPAIYLNPLYRKFLEGASLESLIDEIFSFDLENRKVSHFDLSFYTGFSQARDGIVCRLMNYELNRSLLKQIPHRRFLDLAVVYCYRLDRKEFGPSSILVQNAHLEHWQVAPGLLHAIAAFNTRRLLPFRLCSLSQVLQESPEASQEELPIPEPAQPTLYVLSNEALCFGAVNLIFADVLSSVGDRLGDDFYLLPSSIHECMILPVSGWEGADPQKLREIVTEINAQSVAPDEVLGSSVYRYERDGQSLGILVPGHLPPEPSFHDIT